MKIIKKANTSFDFNLVSGNHKKNNTIHTYTNINDRLSLSF